MACASRRFHRGHDNIGVQNNSNHLGIIYDIVYDVKWQVLAGIGYSSNDCWNLVGGYRHQYIDYQEDGFLYDINMGGPVLGAVYKF